MVKMKSVRGLGLKIGTDDGLADGEFICYPSTFTKEPDAYGDIVAPGAFADTIAEWQRSGNFLPGIYGHRLDDPDYFVAHATEMTEDEHGWRVRGVFDLENPKALQVYKLVKGRRLTQLSFAFDVQDEAKVTLKDGRTVNELRKLKVYEFTFCPIGANQDTSVVAVKAGADLAARVAALEDAIKAIPLYAGIADASDASGAAGDGSEAASAVSEVMSSVSPVSSVSVLKARATLAALGI